VKKQILIVTLIIVGSFTVGLAISEYRQRAAITIHYDITEYNDDGTISDTSKIVRVCNRRGDWYETQILANGNLRPSHGKVTPRDESLASFPEAPRKEILGRTVVVLSDRRSDVWYDPSLHQLLKIILYTDDTRQTVQMVRDAVEIKD
jgi:hypothetical protein